MVNRKFVWIICLAALLAVTSVISGCEKAAETPGDSFIATWQSDEGMMISINGSSDVYQAGSYGEFQLEFHNKMESGNWTSGYDTIFIDYATGRQWEIGGGIINLQPGKKIQEQLNIEFPDDFNGILGLWVRVEGGGSLIALLEVEAYDPPPAVFTAIDELRGLYRSTLYFPVNHTSLVFGRLSVVQETEFEEMTMDTTLPGSPERMRTYRVIRPVVDEAYAREMASRIGFEGELGFHDADSTWRVSLGLPNEDTTPVFSLYEDGNIAVWYDRSRKTSQSVPSDEKCIAAARKWLESRDLYPDNIADTRVVAETYTIMQGQESIETYTRGKIVSFMIGLDGYELLGMGAHLIIGEAGEVLEVHVNVPEFQSGPYVAVLNPGTVIDRLKEYLENPALFWSETPECLVREINKNVMIDSVSLGLFAMQGQNAYAQPIFILEGEGNNGPDSPVHDFVCIADAVAR